MGNDYIKTYQGITYLAAEDVKMAMTEEETIEKIEEKLKGEDIRKSLMVYNALVENQSFHTPVGISYLRILRERMIKGGIAQEEICNYEMPYVLSPGLRKKKEYRRDQEHYETQIRLHRKYRTSLSFNIAFLLIILGMFVIMLTSKQPTILNYESKLRDKYSSWEQELNERERDLRTRERNLKLNE